MMTVMTIRSTLVYDCDGHCGARADVEGDIPEAPAGWVAFHFCPGCREQRAAIPQPREVLPAIPEPRGVLPAAAVLVDDETIREMMVPRFAAECSVCQKGEEGLRPLADSIGHDAMGHRAARALHRFGLKRIEESEDKEDEDLLTIAGFGPALLARVRLAADRAPLTPATSPVTP